MALGVVGVDIGSTMLRAVEFNDATKAKPTILKVHELPLPDGSVKRGEVIEVNTVASTFKRLWASAGFRSKDVAMGIGGQSVIVRDLSVPRMPLAQIRESLPFQVQDLLPVPVNDAVLDYYPLSESTSESGPVVNGLLIAAFKQAVTKNITAATLARLKPVSMDLLPFAMSRMHSIAAPSPGFAVQLNIGANASTIVIVENSIPQFVRIIPAGGDDTTRALMSRLNYSRDNAEAIKIRLGLTWGSGTEEERLAATVVHELTSELLTSVRNTLSYFTGVRGDASFRQISVAGGATRLSGFANALAEATRIAVIPVEPLSTVNLARGVRDRVRRDPHRWTNAISLAMGSLS